jgi:hypothetical protein
MSTSSPDSSEGWEARPPYKCQGVGVNAIHWAGNSNIMSALYPTGTTILTHTVLKKKMKDNLKMIQVSNKAVEVRLKSDDSNKTDF